MGIISLRRERIPEFRLEQSFGHESTESVALHAARWYVPTAISPSWGSRSTKHSPGRSPATSLFKTALGIPPRVSPTFRRSCNHTTTPLVHEWRYRAIYTCSIYCSSSWHRCTCSRIRPNQRENDATEDGALDFSRRRIV